MDCNILSNCVYREVKFKSTGKKNLARIFKIFYMRAVVIAGWEEQLFSLWRE